MPANRLTFGTQWISHKLKKKLRAERRKAEQIARDAEENKIHLGETIARIIQCYAEEEFDYNPPIKSYKLRVGSTTFDFVDKQNDRKKIPAGWVRLHGCIWAPPLETFIVIQKK